jgi:hypothetical protein
MANVVAAQAAVCNERPKPCTSETTISLKAGNKTGPDAFSSSRSKTKRTGFAQGISVGHFDCV